MPNTTHIVDPASPEDARIEREEAHAILVVGQWVWVKGRDWEDETVTEWLACVTDLGSNYVELCAPSGSAIRVHFDDATEKLRHEPDPDAVINAQIHRWTHESKRLLSEVRELSARLGLKTAGALPAPHAQGSATGLVVMSGQTDIAGYKAELIEAKDATLPALFEEIRRVNEKLKVWMTAPTLPLKASISSMKESLGEITDRLFNLSLYAGLVENAVRCSDGTPASPEAKLHVMQRRLYMDEECLLNYTAGGMTFSNINAFDAWLSKPENRDRILPFPRTLVAMRVRRRAQDREWDGSLLSTWINIHAEHRDKFTYLYVRNGEQVWRIGCEMEFGEMIFPDKSLYDPSEAMMVRVFAGHVSETITRGEYDARYAQWETTPEAKRWSLSFRPENWSPCDSSNVYFDECLAIIASKIKEYNRIVLIIQGLFDRSQVLHPHPPVQTWTPDGFNQAIQLVYDAQMVLDNGAPPDFEAYRARCNASLTAGSITAGQDIYWEVCMAEREMRRRRADYRLSESERYRTIKRWRPDGNPGPGTVAVIQEWKPRNRVAKFKWQRQRWTRYGDEHADASVQVPATALFNVSAYTPGDYLQFFRDHRTRAQYLQWAPLLLAAEDYHAGQAAPKT